MKPKVLFIAEAGVNHNGSLELAYKLIDCAAECGADYVKFQTFKTELLVSPTASKADYQKINTTDYEESQFAMLKKLELSEEHHRELIKYCKQKGIRFLSTAFDLPSIDFLSSLGIDLFKIPSGEITNFPYLRKIASQNKPVILSTGMATFEEVQDAVKVLYRFGVTPEKLTVLHCTTEYPVPLNEVNLHAMKKMGEDLNLKYGYSDHTQGIEVSIAAVALGASVIEKHFTLDRLLPGPDHAASLEPEELRLQIQAIRNIEKALGDEEKQVTPSELKNRIVARKSIVAIQNIKNGEEFSEQNLAVKRPGDGLSPMKWEELIGKKATREYLPDEQIETTVI